MTREQKFYRALQDIFVGAKVEGESGYTNLLDQAVDQENHARLDGVCRRRDGGPQELGLEARQIFNLVVKI